MAETTYKTKGFVEVEGKEFEYSATLYFGDTRRPDDIEIEPINDEDQAFYEENTELIEGKVSTQAHEQYWKERK